MATNDWFLNILRDMIKDKTTLVLLGKMKIIKEKSTMTAFNFSISINKSVFEDVLSEEEKGLLWLEGNDER